MSISFFNPGEKHKGSNLEIISDMHHTNVFHITYQHYLRGLANTVHTIKTNTQLPTQNRQTDIQTISVITSTNPSAFYLI